ncbi:prepilin-type N-terminal cleavage/methylation domain-containing protein [Coraliomargarita algicola]|uniref:Prepilin-type N-terminal cleavage/methylation domain-containing protein n=1 Tax=Coraliomargarita algicola TaxID=3092156 RepID=A0ABZ0RN46_9BACT|nr:prepilin-type N-terminal cleavage/methylation domain-containing protein [Coraliomargarita sp. J2-16]WPJ97646.1 prepilin-type N-terminal cleavage/methylation domain-containing protein [Coraliomargarita sp. J2-16]
MHSQHNALFTPHRTRRQTGFSLIEVVLAIGIFLVTVLALVGLLGPTLQSVDEVEKTDEVASVVNTVNAFLQNSPEIANADESKFETIFNAVAGDGYATIFVFRKYASANSDDVSLKIGFFGETSATVDNSDITTGSTVLAAGPIYRVVLTPSSVTPDTYLSSTVRDSDTGVYSLQSANIDNYLEGYFAMEVRIYVENASPTFDGAKLPANPGETAEDASLSALNDKQPLFTYNTAIVR